MRETLAACPRSFVSYFCHVRVRICTPRGNGLSAGAGGRRGVCKPWYLSTSQSVCVCVRVCMSAGLQDWTYGFRVFVQLQRTLQGSGHDHVYLSTYMAAAGEQGRAAIHTYTGTIDTQATRETHKGRACIRCLMTLDKQDSQTDKLDSPCATDTFGLRRGVCVQDTINGLMDFW